MSASFIESSSVESVESAAAKVAQHIDSMADSSDIFDRLTQSGTTPVSGLGEKFYIKGSPEFVTSRKIPIPGELQIQMNNIHSEFSMGLFTQISRAWVVIDTNLYMWNYETNDDLAYFDSADASIYKVALVNMKPGVFEPQIKYGLIVGTVSDISLYPIFETADSSISIDTNRFFRISLDGAIIHDIVHTNIGRVFYTANDKLFEFHYEKQIGWFGASHKCKSVNQSASILGTLIPLPFFGNTKEVLEQVTVDKSRNILYCLGKLGSIIVFDLGEDGQACQKICSVPASKIAHEAHLLTQFGHDESTFTHITSIKALEAHQSSQLNLVATTVKGVRMYLSVLSRNLNNTGGFMGGYQNTNNAQRAQQQNVVSRYHLQSEVRPQCLRVAHVRFAPGITPTSIYGDGPAGVSVVYADETICAMATADRNVVFAFSNLMYPSSSLFVESATECEVSGHVWEIEAVKNVFVKPRAPPAGVVEKVASHSYYQSQLEDNLRLLVCSNEGIFEFQQITAVDALRDALYNGGVEGKATVQLWQKIGSTEMLILAFRILTSDAPIDERIKSKAEQILYSLKEAPEIVENDRLMADASVWSPNESSIADWTHRMKTPLLSSTPRLQDTLPNVYNSPFSPILNTSIATGATNLRMSPSRRHDALFYYFSRIVSPIWNDTICEVLMGKSLRITFEPDRILFLRNELLKLGRIMDEYRLVPNVDFGGYANNMSDKLNAEATSLERKSLVGLRKLVDSTIETVSLWILANEYNLSAISAGMNPAILPTFASRKLALLVSDGSNLNAELIRAMIKFFLGDEAGTKHLSENLREKCPNLYSEDDACVTYAMEQLESARKLGIGAARRKLVQSAVEMFKQSIGKVVLTQTCQQLIESVGAFEEVVELCLLRANKDDPKQLALLAYKHGRNGADLEMRAAEKKRNDCYKVITDELDKLEEQSTTDVQRDSAMNRDLMINAVIQSEDQLAHAAVFRWLLTKNKTNAILQSKSPHVEFFLLQEINSGRGQKYFDLLWRFYEKSGNYDKAARLLSKLAENDNWQLGLAQRCAYLSHAILCAKSCKDPTITENVDELRDRLEVANIQMRIKEALDVPTPRGQSLVKELDGQILSLTDLLLKYVVPFKLHKIKLALFHCANMYVEEHIFETWEAVLQDEFMTAPNEATLCENLLVTVEQLFAVFGKTKYFPLDFIIRRILEIGSGGINENQRVTLPPNFYPKLCSRIDLADVEFLKMASDEFRTGGDVWWTQNERGQEYITKVVLRVAKNVVRDLESVPAVNRRSISRDCLTHILPFIRRSCDVSSSTNLQTLGSELTSIQHRLSEFSN
ncbi:unnamed protein product [Caenorhabditis angaria]|uniref:Nucleoporin Nup133/Nup155-like N-terminal domain-containing protein n=1 Tax=Caenorhabditis angaria TaxID=860376 RepID=A0A9P1IP57_9PELO|nr:unnamed protein product [Caenorhabditis angaria]